MRGMVLSLALVLCGLCLSAGPAQAGPLTAFIGGALNALGAGTWLASGAVGAWSAGFAVGNFLGGSVLGRLVLSFGINAISAALYRPKLPTPQDQIVNLSQPLSFMQRVYGRVRKGGPVIFTGFSGVKRYYSVAIAAHRTKGPVTHYLDTYPVEIDVDGWVTTEPAVNIGPVGEPSYGRIACYRGLPGQVAPPFLTGTFAEVTSAFDFAGISHAVIIASRAPGEAASQVYPSGVQWAYAPVWDGWDEIYDPRSDTTGWTDNAALIIAHEALFHGKSVDWDNVAEEADVADQLVTNAESGTQKRWTLGITLEDNVTWEQARDALGLACDAFFYETPDGKVGFKLGRYEAPLITLEMADLLTVTVAEKSWGPDVPGEAVIKYTEPAFDWQQASCGAIVVDAGKPRLETDAWAAGSHNQACRLAKRMIRRARARYTLQAQVKLIGYELIGRRFFSLYLADLGLEAVFEVDKLLRNGDGVTFSLDATSVLAEDFDFVALTEEPARPAREVVASDDSVAGVTGLAGEVVAGTGGVAQIEWTWPQQDVSLQQELQMRSLDGGMPDWQSQIAASGQLSLVVAGLTDGATYEAQIRNRTSFGRVSGWSGSVSVLAVANTTAPAALTGFAAAVSGGVNGVLSWTAPNDPNYSAARIWRGTTATFSAAVLVHTEYGAPSLADGWTDSGLTTGTYYYWAAPINGSGVEGTVTGPQSITII